MAGFEKPFDKQPDGRLASQWWLVVAGQLCTRKRLGKDARFVQAIQQSATAPAQSQQAMEAHLQVDPLVQCCLTFPNPDNSMSNSDRFSRLLKSGSANPVLVGAAIGAGVGLLTGPFLLATAIGGAVGAYVASKKR